MPSLRARAPLPALLALLLALLPCAAAHGALTNPRARGTLRTFSLGLPDVAGAHVPADGCPHCLNGGGTGAVLASTAGGGWRPYAPLTAGGRRSTGAGPCGDRAADKRPRAHERGGAFCPAAALDVRSVYRAGAHIDIEVAVTTNHNGFFEFFLCDVKRCGGDPGRECFEGGWCRQLRRAKVPECEAGGSLRCAPTDPRHTGRFYLPCRRPGTQFVRMKYELPRGFVCEDCVLQWYWATANSCNPPGVKEFFRRFPMERWGKCPGDGGAVGGRNPMLAECGGERAPEEFWMCADVRVEAGGEGDDGRRKTMVEGDGKKEGSRRRRGKEEDAEERDDGDDDNQDDDDGDDNDDDDKSFRPKGVVPVQMPMQLPSKHEWKAPPMRSDGAWMASKAAVEKAKPARHVASPAAGAARKQGGTCVADWHQCGGLHYKGATGCCNAKLQCVSVNEYYAQCKPVASG